jgi:mannose-6-phosphate isomerase-like protein (cupin superfamily)
LATALRGAGSLAPVAHAGQEIHGANGFRLRLIRTGAETGGELLEMEGSWSGEGGLPPNHFHPRQDEHFEVLEGTLHTVIGGTERRFSVGDAFDVPAGTPHRMAGDGPARAKWEVRPALRTAEFFERLYGDGPDSARAMGSDFMAEFSEEYRPAEA